MDSATLERSIRSRENSLDSLETLLAVMTALVVVGLVLEYWHEIPEAIADLRRARRILWKPVCIIAGAILITVGVGGELLVQFFASGTQTELRSDNHQVEILLGERAAQAQLDTQRLRAALADRDLSQDQQKMIRDSLKSYVGKNVFIRSYPNDPEAARLIIELKAALEPQIHVEDRTGDLGPNFANGLVLGIRILPNQRERDFAEALVDSFRNDGKLLVDDLTIFGGSDSPTDILVGVKPVALAQQTARITSQRHLAAPARARVSTKLKEFSGQKFNLFGYSSDPEIIAFANEFLFACCNKAKGAGWMETLSSAPIGDLIGVIVLVKPDADTHTRAAASALAAALKFEQIAVAGPRVERDHKAASKIEPTAPLQGTFDANNPITMVIGKIR
jgi:hypothetical protein